MTARISRLLNRVPGKDIKVAQCEYQVAQQGHLNPVGKGKYVGDTERGKGRSGCKDREDKSVTARTLHDAAGLSCSCEGRFGSTGAGSVWDREWSRARCRAASHRV